MAQFAIHHTMNNEFLGTLTVDGDEVSVEAVNDPTLDETFKWTVEKFGVQRGLDHLGRSFNFIDTSTDELFNSNYEIAKAHWQMVNIINGAVAGIVQTDDDPNDPLVTGFVGENPPIGFRTGIPLREYVREAREFNFEPMNDHAEAVKDNLPDLIRATGDAIARVIEAHGEISKIDVDKRLAFGWAYVSHDKDGKVSVDKSGEFVDDYEELEKAAYNFVVKSRAGDADHTNVKTSEMVESMVFTPEKIAKMGLPPGVLPTGWWVGFRIEDDDLWKSVKEGKRLAFSVHGKGTRKQVDD